MRITQVRAVATRALQDVGTLEPAWEPGASMRFRRGGAEFVEVHTDAGLVGLGPGVKGRVLEAARALLVGKAAPDPEDAFERLRYLMRDQRGMAGVDIALWDLEGKRQGASLARRFAGGGGGRDRVLAYASMIRLGEPQERADLAVSLQQQGWQAIKLRLHGERLADDIAIVARVRAAVGDSMRILCDANQAQSPGAWQPGVRWGYERALDTARELAQLGVGWLEEPLPRYDWTGLRRLREQGLLPIAGGENLRLQEFLPLVEAKAYDIVQPDAMVVDGLTGLRRVFALAAAHGVEVVPHHGGRGLGTIAHLHAVAAAPSIPFVEALHDPPIGDFAHGFAPLVGAPTLDADGCFAVPTGPGLGVALDPAFVAGTD